MRDKTHEGCSAKSHLEFEDALVAREASRAGPEGRDHERWQRAGRVVNHEVPVRKVAVDGRVPVVLVQRSVPYLPPREEAVVNRDPRAEEDGDPESTDQWRRSLTDFVLQYLGPSCHGWAEIPRPSIILWLQTSDCGSSDDKSASQRSKSCGSGSSGGACRRFRALSGLRALHPRFRACGVRDRVRRLRRRRALHRCG